MWERGREREREREGISNSCHHFFWSCEKVSACQPRCTKFLHQWGASFSFFIFLPVIPDGWSHQLRERGPQWSRAQGFVPFQQSTKVSKFIIASDFFTKYILSVFSASNYSIGVTPSCGLRDLSLNPNRGKLEWANFLNCQCRLGLKVNLDKQVMGFRL